MEKVKPSDAVRLKRGTDITQLPLGAMEGFILSRLDGSTRVKDIILSTGLGESTAMDVLQNLLVLGVIHVDHTRDGEGDSDEAQLGPPTTLTEEQKAEPVDLPPDTRLRIIQAAWHARYGNHYTLLGLPRGAGAEEIRRTYYERSREFHPDAFFRKKLGSYKALVEQVFKAIKKASDELSEPARRAEYDRALPREAPVAQAPAPVPEWKLDPRRQAEAEARRLRANPMMQRVERARRHVQRARELITQKQWAAAANELALAAAQDPRDPNVPSLQAEVSEKLREERWTRQLQRLEYLCGSGDAREEDVAPVVRELLDAADPGDGPSHFRLARTLVRAGLHKLARTPADRALKANPDDPPTLAIVVDLMEEAGLLLNATRTLERLVTLQPTPERKARLEELRKRAPRR